MGKSHEDRLTDTEIRALIARADVLDQTRLTTPEDFRRIAGELGISSEAVESALRERALALEGGASRRLTASNAATLLAVGLPLGVIAGTLIGNTGALGLGSIGFTALRLALIAGIIAHLGRRPSLRAFLVQNFVFWVSVGAGGVASVTLIGAAPIAIPGILVAWCVRSWIFASVLGSAAIVAIRRVAGDAESGPGSRPHTFASRARRAVGQAIDKATTWVTRHLRRTGQEMRNGRTQPVHV